MPRWGPAYSPWGGPVAGLDWWFGSLVKAQGGVAPVEVILYPSLLHSRDVARCTTMHVGLGLRLRALEERGTVAASIPRKEKEKVTRNQVGGRRAVGGAADADAEHREYRSDVLRHGTKPHHDATPPPESRARPKGLLDSTHTQGTSTRECRAAVETLPRKSSVWVSSPVPGFPTWLLNATGTRSDQSASTRPHQRNLALIPRNTLENGQGTSRVGGFFEGSMDVPTRPSSPRSSTDFWLHRAQHTQGVTKAFRFQSWKGARQGRVTRSESDRASIQQRPRP